MPSSPRSLAARSGGSAAVTIFASGLAGAALGAAQSLESFQVRRRLGTGNAWAKAREYGRYLASSIKGEAAIDWSDKRARTALLAGIVADADRLLELSRQAQGDLGENSAESQQIAAAAELLGRLPPFGVFLP